MRLFVIFKSCNQATVGIKRIFIRFLLFINLNANERL